MNKILTLLSSEKGKAILRHFITFVGGTLVTLGYVEESLLEVLTGSGATIFGVILSLLHKKNIQTP